MSNWISFFVYNGNRKMTMNLRKSTTTEELHQQVAEKNNYKLHLLRLSFGGTIIERSNNTTLEDCDLYAHATVVALYRVSGGANSECRKIGKNIKMSHKPDAITLTTDDPTMELPCGHAITPESLAMSIDDQVKSHKTDLRCPICFRKWKLSQIKDMGLTTKEKEAMEIGLGKNLFFDTYHCKQCPQCNTFIEKMNEGIRIKCPTCRNYEFCWVCLRKWIKPGPGYKVCGNTNCDPVNSELNQLLKTCNTVTINNCGVKAPAIRTCPNCGQGINYNGGCKHMLCRTCSTDFCFVCLSIKSKSATSWPCGSYTFACKAAPRQTVKH